MSKSIHPNIVKNGARCAFCPPHKRILALWRADTGFLDMKNIACDKHRDQITEEEPEDANGRTSYE